jgi:hypothetical protein
MWGYQKAFRVGWGGFPGSFRDVLVTLSRGMSNAGATMQADGTAPWVFRGLARA